jgi:AbrB family looped-hinge helix DNA binding protein
MTRMKVYVREEHLAFAAKILPQNSNPTYQVLTDFTCCVILIHMSTTEKLETVWFTTKGQVVIPLRLRKQFDIEDGTKAVVQATPDGILLKPMTAALIKRGRGILKRTPGGKPLTEDWAEHKRQERALEGRHAG